MSNLNDVIFIKLQETFLVDYEKSRSTIIRCEELTTEIDQTTFFKSFEEQRTILTHLRNILSTSNEKEIEEELGYIKMRFRLSLLFSYVGCCKGLINEMFSYLESTNNSKIEIRNIDEKTCVHFLLNFQNAEDFVLNLKRVSGKSKKLYDEYKKKKDEIDNHIIELEKIIEYYCTIFKRGPSFIATNNNNQHVGKLPHSDKIVLRARGVLDEYHDIVLFTIIGIEKKLNKRKLKFACTEIRDFLHHFQNAITCHHEYVALIELELGAEHLRRAVVESLQLYIKNRLRETIAFTSTYPFSDQTSKELVEIKIMNTKLKVAIARRLKSTRDWIKAYQLLFEIAKDIDSYIDII